MKTLVILAVIALVILLGLVDPLFSKTAMLFIKSIASGILVFCFTVWWKIYK